MADRGDKLGLVIFGATGFTGKEAVYEIIKFAKERGVTWGVAGRSKEKLESVLKEVAEKTNEDLSSIPVIVADVQDEESLKQMAAQAQVVLNCVGPYRFFGRAVVSACISSGAHHVDISGEPQYIESMQLEFNEAAEEHGVYSISACGFDSIPADLGVVFVSKKFEGVVNSIETYLCPEAEKPPTGAVLHYTTYESAVHGYAHLNELRPLRQKLYPNRLPDFTPKLKPRSVVHKRENIGWSFPFLGSDRSVALRSQRYLFEHDKQRPIQIQTYFALKSIWSVILLGFFGMFFALLAKFKFGRSVLLKYPKLFSGGYVSHEGPDEETRKSCGFSITFFAEGWKEKLPEPTDQYTSPPNKRMVVKVSGKNPGYGLTSVMLLLSAITIVKESDKMPGRGGVLSPGAAFAKTSLLEELQKHGLNFEVLSTADI